MQHFLTIIFLPLSHRPISMIIEPILREPGSVAFSWLEIQRTKASLVQHIETQTNFTANETLQEYGLFPKDGDCEYKCPELDACIASSLWCDGNYFLCANDMYNAAAAAHISYRLCCVC